MVQLVLRLMNYVETAIDDKLRCQNKIKMNKVFLNAEVILTISEPGPDIARIDRLRALS